MRVFQATDQRDKSGGAVEEGEATFHPVGANGHFAAVDAIGKVDAFGPGGFNLPAIFAGSGEAEGLTIVAGNGYGIDVFGELTDEVRAWGPDRHEDFDTWARHRNIGVDGNVVGLRFGETHGIANGVR